jgi:DNA-binding MarR family transcriptional regulator
VPQQLPVTGSQPIPTFWQAVFPKQMVPVEVALRLLKREGLSRAHKHVFLLIDGQRTVEELARITRRQTSELSQLLDDLERIGVVQR